MEPISKPQLAVYVAAAIAVALLGARYVQSHDDGAGVGGGSGARGAGDSGGSERAVRVERSGGGPAVVDVAGAVRRPGVYRLPASSRVDDAVREAGGATPKADLGGVNLAAKVEDGRQYLVPERAPAGAAPAGDPTAAGAGAGRAAQPLNLNTATAEQLDQLDGVGPETARKILAYRQQKGGFRSVDELDQVPGIGPQRLATLRELVRV
jgi:competence protein ComEA